MLEGIKKQVYEANMEHATPRIDHLYMGKCQRN